MVYPWMTLVLAGMKLDNPPVNFSLEKIKVPLAPPQKCVA